MKLDESKMIKTVLRVCEPEFYLTLGIEAVGMFKDYTLDFDGSMEIIPVIMMNPRDLIRDYDDYMITTNKITCVYIHEFIHFLIERGIVDFPHDKWDCQDTFIRLNEMLGMKVLHVENGIFYVVCEDDE